MRIEDHYSKSFFISNKMTATLEHFIESIDSWDEFERRFPQEFLDKDTHVADYLEYLLFKYKKKKTPTSVAAQLDRSYLSNIINGVNPNPSRDTLLAICLAIGTTIDEAQYLLKYAGHAPLYVRRRRDVIIWFGFLKKKNTKQVNDELYDHDEKPLTSK